MRLLVILLCCLLLTACGTSGTPVTDESGNTLEDVLVVDVNVHGRLVTCVIYSYVAGYAGMGGISCDWGRG